MHAFTVKFQYLQIPPLLPLLSISSTYNFHPNCFYRHIPVPANSNFVTLPSVSTTCKFQPHKMHYFQFPPCCLYCHIPVLAISTPFTAKFHYLQIQRPRCDRRHVQNQIQRFSNRLICFPSCLARIKYQTSEDYKQKLLVCRLWKLIFYVWNNEGCNVGVLIQLSFFGRP